MASPEVADHSLGEILAEERQLMNANAAGYRRNPAFNSYYYRDERRFWVGWILEALRQAGEDPARLSFLECGSSTGDNLALLHQAGCRRLAGLDLAEAMLSPEHHAPVPGARLFHGSIEEHDFRGEQFDVVLGAFTLHHMHDARAFFRLVDRVLRPGGWCIVVDYNGGSWTHGRWTKPLFHWLMIPFRILLKLKNRRLIALNPTARGYTNHAHHLMTRREIERKMTQPGAYVLRCQHTQGGWMPALNYGLMEESALDRALFRAVRMADRIVEPFGKGAIQGVIWQRVIGS